LLDKQTEIIENIGSCSLRATKPRKDGGLIMAYSVGVGGSSSSGAYPAPLATTNSGRKSRHKKCYELVRNLIDDHGLCDVNFVELSDASLGQYGNVAK